ncbi:adenylate/guanylate cyclase domain-containing protein [Stenotrophomonas sp. 278]|uniref:adenylate/guanylate cyclase domain-containing protein n=1 Tax=Stenotrophomonas sp. 278 TaxID=2479851 RepID=UPI001639B100|nr:adenylate/guanylate cyclase domain-containing protein [Stenotrophomonas sp. 278]
MSPQEPDADESGCRPSVLGRFDFVCEQVQLYDGQVELRLEPDPRRYTRIEVKGEACYLDRFTKVAIPVASVEQAIRSVPLYDLRPRISSTSEYGIERASAVSEELHGEPFKHPVIQPAHHKEPVGESSSVSTPFLSLDICGSTELRRRDAVAFDKATEVLLRELQILVGQFEAAVLKDTGDGFIVHLPHPSFTRQCDLIVDLGTSMIKLVKESLSPVLESAGLPRLSVRVGADYGPALIETKTNAITGFSWPSVRSDALNLAVKIEQTCAPNTMRIGNELYNLLHVQWLLRARRVPADSLPRLLVSYPVYEVT